MQAYFTNTQNHFRLVVVVGGRFRGVRSWASAFCVLFRSDSAKFRAWLCRRRRGCSWLMTCHVSDRVHEPFMAHELCRRRRASTGCRNTWRLPLSQAWKNEFRGGGGGGGQALRALRKRTHKVHAKNSKLPKKTTQCQSKGIIFRNIGSPRSLPRYKFMGPGGTAPPPPGFPSPVLSLPIGIMVKKIGVETKNDWISNLQEPGIVMTLC